MKKNDDLIRFNPLLESLVIVTKLFKKPFTAQALTAGLPVEAGKATPDLFTIDKAKSEFSRAAKKAGLISQLVRRELSDISALVLPTILVLKDNNACILTGFDATKKHAEVIIPELGDTKQWVLFEDLEKEYLGFAFYLKQALHDEPALNEKNIISDKNRHWFWDTVKLSRNIYRDTLIASFMINIFVLATPLFTMNVYDRVVPNSATETLWVLALGVIIIFVFDTVLKFLRAYFLEVAGKKNDVIMSSLLFEKVMDIKMEAYPKSVGTFANHIKEFNAISNFFASATLSILIDLPFVLIFLMTIYAIAGAIVLVPIFSILIILGYTLLIKDRLEESIESSYASAAKKFGILIESLSTLETLKTSGSVGQTQWKWEEASGDIAQKGIKTRILSSSIITVTSLVIQINIISILIVGVYMITANTLSMGGLIAAVILASCAIAPMGNVAGLFANYEQVKTTYNVLNDIMKLPVERPIGKKFLHRPDFSGKIEFRDVSFTYEGCERKLFDHLSFTIQAQEKVAILGKIGSGKTSIEKLILGLYTPQEGSILMDNIEMGQIDPVDIRKNISYVAQDVVLFKGTVKDNIIVRSQDATDAQIIKASQISGIDTFVNKHPKGFDMEVGEQGMGLSGGQKQSIALARALLTNTPIYLFDEPTNAIDGSEEKQLIGKLQMQLKDKTVVLITHKPALLALVDRIIVLDEGKIVLDGTKDKVLKALEGKA